VCDAQPLYFHSHEGGVEAACHSEVPQVVRLFITAAK